MHTYGILSYCRIKRIEWVGHVEGKRPVGRPRTRWKDVVEKDIKTIHESIRILRMQMTEFDGMSYWWQRWTYKAR